MHVVGMSPKGPSESVHVHVPITRRLTVAHSGQDELPLSCHLRKPPRLDHPNLLGDPRRTRRSLRLQDKSSSGLDGSCVRRSIRKVWWCGRKVSLLRENHKMRMTWSGLVMIMIMIIIINLMLFLVWWWWWWWWWRWRMMDEHPSLWNPTLQTFFWSIPLYCPCGVKSIPVSFWYKKHECFRRIKSSPDEQLCNPSGITKTQTQCG